MDNKLQKSVDISLAKKLCAFGLLVFIVGVFIRYNFIPLIGKIIFNNYYNFISSFYYSFMELSKNISNIIYFGGAVAYIIGIFIFSKKLNNGDIFKNFIFSVIVIIIGVISCAILCVSYIGFIFRRGQSFGAKSDFVNMLFLFFTLFVLWLSFVLSAFFSKKYLDIFYEYTKVDLFKYAGLVVLGGSILFGILYFIRWILDIFYEYTKVDLFKYAGLVVLGGSILFEILYFIGWILAVVAFFRMPDNLESNQS
jgi:uncharacterized membrane protein